MALLQLIGLCNGEATPFDGQYLVEYDPARTGTDADGSEMQCHLVTTPDARKALTFSTAHEALEMWRLAHGMRQDGEPNRPLMAFNVAVIPDQAIPARVFDYATTVLTRNDVIRTRDGVSLRILGFGFGCQPDKLSMRGGKVYGVTEDGGPGFCHRIDIDRFANPEEEARMPALASEADLPF